MPANEALGKQFKRRITPGSMYTVWGSQVGYRGTSDDEGDPDEGDMDPGEYDEGGEEGGEY